MAPPSSVVSLCPCEESLPSMRVSSRSARGELRVGVFDKLPANALRLPPGHGVRRRSSPDLDLIRSASPHRHRRRDELEYLRARL